MSDTITTYSGIHFDPVHPEAEKFRIEDIAHALSYICRGNGHVHSFFSVGQHCIHCAKEAAARGYSDRVALACLLHDAGEVYMSDVPRPFKKSLPHYIEAEEKLLSLIYKHFLGTDLSVSEAALVKQIDDDMLCYDLSVLLNERIEKGLPTMKTFFSYDPIPFEQVETEYLSLFHALQTKI